MTTTKEVADCLNILDQKLAPDIPTEFEVLTAIMLTYFSKNSFYLLPEPLRRGEFLTNY